MKKILENTRVLCDGMRGQNYWLHGCLEYLMECLGEPPYYDYWFFSGVTGDSFIQTFSKDPAVEANCYSMLCMDESLLRKAFDACGYDFEYVSGIGGGNRDNYLPKIREYIDNGLPVISRGGEDTWDSPICGYEDDALYYLICDNAEPQAKRSTFRELIFVKGKKPGPTPAECCRSAVMEIPSLLTKPSARGFTFGRQAFADWSESFQNGMYDSVPLDRLNPWNAHGAYLFVAGTNGCARGFLQAALQVNSDMLFINELLPFYEKQQEIFDCLAYSPNPVMQGGFHIRPEAIKNKELMRPVSSKIMESAECCDRILEVFSRV